MKTLADRLASCPFVAILRGVRPDEVEEIARALLGEGLSILEVPLNSPNPLESIALLSKRFGTEALVGAGTVLSPEEASAVAGAGGKLCVMPNSDRSVVLEARRHGMVTMPGIATPTEAFAMLSAGADALKLFPAEGSSPAMLSAMRAVLPKGTMVLPVGGIGEGNLKPWLAAGAAGFGIGSSLYKPGSAAVDVGRKAQALMAAWRAAR